MLCNAQCQNQAGHIQSTCAFLMNRKSHKHVITTNTVLQLDASSLPILETLPQHTWSITGNCQQHSSPFSLQLSWFIPSLPVSPILKWAQMRTKRSTLKSINSYTDRHCTEVIHISMWTIIQHSDTNAVVKPSSKLADAFGYANFSMNRSMVQQLKLINNLNSSDRNIAADHGLLLHL